ncbi:hypothetical protein D6777_01400 [Candidatus Woesearchaeota archaeon]|nr:MAG: hypothetical protein D6777_01400 [Candidatus Woesearchaeota archaeon]
MIRRKKISKIGTVEVGLPIIEFGEGKPVLSIVAGVHGDETKPLLVLKRFIEEIQKQEINGKIKIFSDANPLAKIYNKRFNVIDFVDLNRIFPGDNQGSISQRVAEALLAELDDSALVIDLHSYHMQTPLMAIAVNTTDEKTMSMIKASNPKQVWLINSVNENEYKFGRSLGAELNKRKITNFAVEINQRNISQDEIEDCVKGLINVCGELGLLKNHKIENDLRMFERTVFTTTTNGLFIPLKKPFDYVKKGDKVGSIYDIETFQEIDVLAESEGVLMQIAWNDMVLIGEEIYAIGKEKNGV